MELGLKPDSRPAAALMNFIQKAAGVFRVVFTLGQLSDSDFRTWAADIIEEGFLDGVPLVEIYEGIRESVINSCINMRKSLAFEQFTLEVDELFRPVWRAPPVRKASAIKTPMLKRAMDAKSGSQKAKSGRVSRDEDDSGRKSRNMSVDPVTYLRRGPNGDYGCERALFKTVERGGLLRSLLSFAQAVGTVYRTVSLTQAREGGRG